MTATIKHLTVCECDLRHRAWNPNTGRCETCGARFEDRREGSPQASDRRSTKGSDVAPEEPTS